MVFLVAVTATPPTAETAPEAVVQAMFDAFNGHDAVAMAKRYANDALSGSSDFCAPRVGSEEVKRTDRALFAELPDNHDEIEQMIVQGDRVAVCFVASRGRANPWLALPISTFLTVRRGLITSDNTTFDTRGRPCLP
jgi:hypothetical protein